MAAAPVAEPGAHDASAAASGVFVVFEGGEGAGKTTQIARVAASLRQRGREVVTTREPGGTEVGARIRALLLDVETGDLDPRTEALLYAADRAEHVAAVVRPALDRGAVVVSDRYVDSSLAYQGAGRRLHLDDVALLSRWATGDLVPHLTVVLDVDPRVGLARFDGADRLESQALDFHDRVRQGFLDLAAREPDRYCVVDASLEPDVVERIVRERLAPMLEPAAR
jgi:dTMP kinase